MISVYKSKCQLKNNRHCRVLLNIVSKHLYTSATPVYWALSVPETLSTPLEYAAPATKLAHRVLFVLIHDLYPSRYPFPFRYPNKQVSQLGFEPHF